LVGVFDATGVLVGVFDATGVLVGVFVGPTGVFVGVLVGPVGVFVRVGVEVGVLVGGVVGVGVGGTGVLVFVAVGGVVGVGPPVGAIVMRSKSGAQLPATGLENLIVLLPAFKLMVVLIELTTSQPPVLGKVRLTPPPPLTLTCAVRLASPFV
jgi:hypothetical protein